MHSWQLHIFSSCPCLHFLLHVPLHNPYLFTYNIFINTHIYTHKIAIHLNGMSYTHHCSHKLAYITVNMRKGHNKYFIILCTIYPYDNGPRVQTAVKQCTRRSCSHDLQIEIYRPFKNIKMVSIMIKTCNCLLHCRVYEKVGTRMSSFWIYWN